MKGQVCLEEASRVHVGSAVTGSGAAGGTLGRPKSLRSPRLPSSTPAVRNEERERESGRRGETYRLFGLSSLGLGVGAIFRLGRLSCRSVFVTPTADVLQGTEQRGVSAKALCQVRGKGSEVQKNKVNTPAVAMVTTQA